MYPEPTLDAIEFAYHGRVYTIWAVPGLAPHSWRFNCRELGLLDGAFATAQDALLGGVAAIIRQRQRTQPTELVA